MINLNITDVPARSGVMNDVTNTDIGCHTYVLTGLSSCGYSAPAEALYINGRMSPIEYQEVEEGTENDSGRFTRDRKSTRLNSSHVAISYAVFCLKTKT